MFGFIRPAKSELRVRELERFKSVYCGLCHSVKKRHGFLYTLFLSFDITFLAVILDAFTENGDVCNKRCIASPIKKKCIACNSEYIDFAADISVILVCKKIDDTINDESGLKKELAKFLKVITKKGYNKAKKLLPEFDQVVTQSLLDLRVIEKEKVPSLDRPADTFARILQKAIPDNIENETKLVLKELFYHVGRYIYLIDACYDIKEDFEKGNYNPILLRYNLKSPEITMIREELQITIAHSIGAVCSALNLLDMKKDRGIAENITSIGMPVVLNQVLEGTYLNNGGKVRHGSL